MKIQQKLFSKFTYTGIALLISLLIKIAGETCGFGGIATRQLPSTVTMKTVSTMNILYIYTSYNILL